MEAVTLRPMAPGDAEGVRLVSVAAFAALDQAIGMPELPDTPPERALMRIEHLMATDPGGCWVGESEGRIVGAAIGVVRESLWGLSLLVVDPLLQTAGLGSALLARAVEHGQAARGRIVLSSADPRAVSAYVGLGLDMSPAAVAWGRPRSMDLNGHVRPGRPEDERLMADVDRHVRGAPHGSDIDVLLAGGSSLLVWPERGYVVRGPDSLNMLAAVDEAAAAELLRAALAAGGAGYVRVEWLTAHQQWAVDVCREAGLRFHVGWGAVFTDGELGHMRPYLPNGAYL